MTEKKPYSQPQLFRVGAEPGASHLKRLQFERPRIPWQAVRIFAAGQEHAKKQLVPVWATAASGLPKGDDFGETAKDRIAPRSSSASN